MTTRRRIRLVPLGAVEHFQMVLYSDENLTLRELLTRAPALSLEPVDDSLMERTLRQLVINLSDAPPDQPLYRPPGLKLEPGATGSSANGNEPDRPSTGSQRPDEQGRAADRPDTSGDEPDKGFPIDIKEEEAVRWAYSQEIDGAASFLRTGLSVLVVCDKLVVEHLWREMVSRALLTPVVLTVPAEEDGGLMPRSLRQRQLARLKELIKDLKQGDVLVIPHLDLLAGGSDANLPTESRELIELVYESSNRLVLAFADRSLGIPEVLAARFAVRISISGVGPIVVLRNGEKKPIGSALITADEAAHFEGYDPSELYKNVAGLNPVRLRHALKYAKEYANENSESHVLPASELPQAIRLFKAQTSANFEAPKVTFDDIGGYEDVKAELGRAIRLIGGSYNLPNEKLRRQLIPRGFIFYGPPGTGKTLFAKAIANLLNATIQVVSGPEVMDMYVGESERKVRELFAEARRNAPAVLVFDEFDAIATKREGRSDGGARAGNAVVAQILTEMDGFRSEVPMLVIGTTNRLDMIDEALLRPSRFKAVPISLPNTTTRRAIAEIHAQHFQIEVRPELLDVIATATEGMNGDDIQSLFRDACVGLYCQDPPLPADAHRFGVLVGALRKGTEQRQASTAERRLSALVVTQGERPRPSSGMVSLTPEETIPAASDELTPEDTHQPAS
jgi:transitional endoplasmic reticulum ATPase